MTYDWGFCTSKPGNPANKRILLGKLRDFPNKTGRVLYLKRIFFCIKSWGVPMGFPTVAHFRTNPNEWKRMTCTAQRQRMSTKKNLKSKQLWSFTFPMGKNRRNSDGFWVCSQKLNEWLLQTPGAHGRKWVWKWTLKNKVSKIMFITRTKMNCGFVPRFWTKFQYHIAAYIHVSIYIYSSYIYI